MNPRKKPRFLRQNAVAYVRLGKKWRRPRGIHSKLKIKEMGKGFIPNPGYGAPRQLRFKHPSGMYESLVHNLSELQRLNPKTHAARIAAGVGRRSRVELMKKAEEMKIRILNPTKIIPKVSKVSKVAATEKKAEAKEIEGEKEKEEGR